MDAISARTFKSQKTWADCNSFGWNALARIWVLQVISMKISVLNAPMKRILNTTIRFGSSSHGNEPSGLLFGLKVSQAKRSRAGNSTDGKRFGYLDFMVHSLFTV